MNHLRNQKIRIELLWWVFTAVLVFAVMIPIILNIPAYPFYYQNTILIVVFVTFTRYIFLLPTTLIAKQKWIKLFIIAVAALVFFVLTTAVSDFRNYMDEEGLQTLVDHLHVRQQISIMNYVKREMIFFGVGSILSTIILPVRMIISLWRVRNRGTV